MTSTSVPVDGETTGFESFVLRMNCPDAAVGSQLLERDLRGYSYTRLAMGNADLMFDSDSELVGCGVMYVEKLLHSNSYSI